MALRASRTGVTGKLRVLLLSLSGLLAVIVALGVAGYARQSAEASWDRTTVYSYDQIAEKWTRDVRSVRAQPLPDGTPSRGSNTIEVRLKENDPVKEILIRETLVIGGTEPLLEIAGRQDANGVKGVIRIGTLTFKTVDAEELHIDADVVRVNMANVVAEDDELDLDLDIVNVVRVGRGGASRLDIGGATAVDLTTFVARGVGVDIEVKERGVRVDRIRILGPEGKVGNVEAFTVLASSVFGRIEVRDVEIQDLILENVSLDDD